MSSAGNGTTDVRPSRPRPRTLRQAPRVAISVFMAIHAVALATCVGALVVMPPNLPPALRCLVLIVLYAVFEEVSRRESNLRIRLSNGPRPDMTSVWTLAAAVALPLGYAVILIALVRGHRWLRTQRTRDVRPYVAWFGFSTSILACTAAYYVVQYVHSQLGHPLPEGLSNGLTVTLAIIAYTLVNRLLVYLAGISLGAAHGQSVLGSWDDNLLELSTLCLGGLTSVALLNEPWITPLVLLPMILLQRGALIRELETVASTDSKTGLLNAIAWEQLAQREMSRATRDLLNVSVLIIDLDRFKNVNDTYGHLAGDVVLREIGRCLTAELRDYDTVGRFGGEEFVALLPDVDAEMAATIAERIRARINSLRMSVLVPSIAGPADDALSASIGVACFPRDGHDVAELLHAADRAMYVAKDAGRNRVEFATAENPPEVEFATVENPPGVESLQF